jgi:programmed cell death protein 4
MSLDGKERERELVSRLLSALYPSLLSTADVGKGFERLFETVDDLQVDVPR